MDYEKAFELAIEAGADDVNEEDDYIEIIGPVESYKKIADRLHAAKVNPDESGLRMVPKQELELEVDETLQVMKVVETLEELDDVQGVYHNMRISEEALAALDAE
jgi:transcriptional/translational regulatory protein YebC/TACO1